MANKFKPKVSSNIIEGATPVEEIEEVVSAEETKVDKKPARKKTVKETKVIESPEETTPVTETPEEVEEEKEVVEIVEEPVVKFDDKETVGTGIERNVKVCLKVNHSCYVGGKHYHFEKGKQVNVPLSVKTILMQADLLMPL